jgi:hypothetical protein
MNMKALYWIALGVIAVVLNSEYQRGNLPLAHRVADRAEAVYCQVAARAQQTLILARALTGSQDYSIEASIARQQSEIDRVMAEHQAELDGAMASRQVDLDRVQAKLDRMHAVLDRVQVEKMRKLQAVSVRLSNASNRRIVICPRTGARFSAEAPDVPEVSVDVDDAQ